MVFTSEIYLHIQSNPVNLTRNIFCPSLNNISRCLKHSFSIVRRQYQLSDTTFILLQKQIPDFLFGCSTIVYRWDNMTVHINHSSHKGSLFLLLSRI